MFEQPATSAPAAAAKGDVTLTLGTVLPQTGSPAFQGPPEFAAVDQAVKEINEAGGVFGKPIAKIHTDSGDTTTNIASIDDKGLYFRTAPPDKLQGRVLGDLIDTVGILAMQDSYGSGLADQITRTAGEAGATVVERVDYDPKAADFSADVARIKAKNPKEVVLIGFEEGAKVVSELV